MARMTKIVATIVFGYSFVACAAVISGRIMTAAAQPATAPELQQLSIVPPSVVVHSKVGDVSDKVVQFRLCNTSGEMLRLEKVQATCSCTIPELPTGRVLKPNEETVLLARVAAKTFGTTAVEIRIETRSSKAQWHAIPVTIVGEVARVPSVTALPKQLEIRAVPGSKACEREFVIETIEAQEDVPWLRTVESPSPRVKVISVNCEKRVPTKGGVACAYLIKIETNVPDAGDSISAIYLKLVPALAGDELSSTIPVILEGLAAVRAIPASVFVVPPSSGAAVSREVVVMSTSEAPITLTINGDIPPWLGVSGSINEPARIQRLHLSADFDAMPAGPGTLQHQLKLSVHGDGNSKLVLPITIERRL